MIRIGGFRRKTRSKFTKPIRQKGKLSITKYLQEFKEGEMVWLSVEPSVQKGMYDPKYLGKSGTIKRKIKNCYEVIVKDYTKEKTLIVHPIHLKRV